jgi:hypothetical protein
MGFVGMITAGFLILMAVGYYQVEIQGTEAQTVSVTP